jgi:hypothetical protein
MSISTRTSNQDRKEGNEKIGDGDVPVPNELCTIPKAQAEHAEEDITHQQKALSQRRQEHRMSSASIPAAGSFSTRLGMVGRSCTHMLQK